jgi:hypothetical protein
VLAKKLSNVPRRSNKSDRDAKLKSKHHRRLEMLKLQDRLRSPNSKKLLVKPSF